MKNILILGAGFGGLAAATELETAAKPREINITLIDRNDYFCMGFSMQWVLVGRRKPEEGQRLYSKLKTKNVKFIQDEIVLIDTAHSSVQTKSNSINYDYLIIALGAELAPQLIPGLYEGAYNLCDLQDVIRLKHALENIEKGTVIVAVSSVPFKCPPAPYEYAMLLDDVLNKRGVRKNTKIIVTTPEPQPMPVAGKTVGDAVKSLLRERGIEFFPEYKIEFVDFSNRKVVYDNGLEFDYNILCVMPPHRAPEIVRNANLADASGFIPVDWNMRTHLPNVYAVGDVTMIKLPVGKPHPKAGIFAELQGMAAAKHIISELINVEPEKYTGKGACYVDTGRDEAAPAEVVDMLAPEGPVMNLQPPSKDGLEGKKQFERERLKKWFFD